MASRLSDLVGCIPGSYFIEGADPVLQSVSSDSRTLEPGSLFAAIRGFKQDGGQFVQAAIRNGAVAVLSEDSGLLDSLDQSIGRLLVPDDRLALAIASDHVFGHPSGSLKLVGVTGTNGKTTTVSLSAAIMEKAGFPTATMGTLGLNLKGELIPGDRTTPEGSEIQRTLCRLVADGIRGLAMEVSSHALSLNRTAGLAFDVVVFTNLTRDHLDYHHSMESYYESKRKLFVDYPGASDKPCTAVINVDDPYGQRLAAEAQIPVIAYGQGEGACLHAESPVIGPTSVAFTARHGDVVLPVRVPLGAHFNLYNSLAAIGVGLALGYSPETISDGLSRAKPVDGRFESVQCGQPFTVIVDYAHTPDGVLNVLKSARAITARKLITVFGCGGDRDPGKRPQMGALAGDLSDSVVVTSDNPRSEDPRSIIDQILAGMPMDRRSRAIVIPDRREAIAAALKQAGEGDVVVIAGKGHETYQIFADRTIHFDDREVVREILGVRQ